MRRVSVILGALGFLAVVIGVAVFLLSSHSAAPEQAAQEQEAQEQEVPSSSGPLSSVEDEYTQAIQGSLANDLQLPDGVSWPSLSEMVVRSDFATDPSSAGFGAGEAELTYEAGTGVGQALSFYAWAWEAESVRAQREGDSDALQKALDKLKEWTSLPQTTQYHANPDDWYHAVVEPARRGDFAAMEEEVSAGPPKLPATAEQAGL